MSWSLVLSGGAFKGAAQVPVIEGLVEKFGMPDDIRGTSIGAANASMLATGDVERLREVWDTIDDISDGQVRQIDAWNGLFKLRRFRKLLQHSGALAIERQCAVGIVDMVTGRHRMVELLPLGLADRLDAITASASMPFIHEKAKFQGRWSVDGGLRNTTPTNRDYASYDVIRVVNLYPWDTRVSRAQANEVNSTFEQLGRSIDILMEQSLKGNVRRLKRWGTSVRVEVYAPPTWESIGDRLKFSPDIRAQRYALGEWMLRNPTIITPS